MGFFDKDEKETEEQRYLAVYKAIQESKIFGLDALLTCMGIYHNHPDKAVIRPTSLFLDMMEQIRKYPGLYPNYNMLISYAERVYRGMFLYGEQSPNFEELCNVFLGFFEPGGVMARNCFSETFFLLFHNPENYVRWFRSIEKDAKLSGVLQYLDDYGTAARSLFPDEETFTANVVSVTKKLLRDPNPQKVYEAELKKVYHLAGIYNVDEAAILKAEQQIETVKSLVECSGTIMDRVDRQAETIGTLADAAVARIKETCATETATVKAETDTIHERFLEEENRLLESQRTVILYEKEKLINEVVGESENRLRELTKNAQSVISSAKLEMSRVNRDADVSMSKIEEYFANHEELKKMLADSEKESEFRAKLDKLTVLSERNIDTMLQAEPAKENAPVKTIVKEAPTGDAVISAEEVADPSVLPDVNPLLDETVDFGVRFQAAMDRKAEMEKNGEHFHNMFDDVLVAVMENANPYLIGPSGCGKTYMVGQIARILGEDFIDIGYINEEYDILGFQTANGGYSRPNFYRCYKYGKIAFCDELDNGNARATVKLNSFLSNVKNAGYNFPNGEHVKRHPNFRMIGAGNTSGNGADTNYNTREKIEESVQQRLVPIYVGYDNSVEQAILGDYTDWYDFVCRFRKATDAWSGNTHLSAPGIVTTRDVARIRRYLDNKSFTADKILNYEFIQTKDDDYLAFLTNHISGHTTKDDPGFALAEGFAAKVELLRNGQSYRG